MKGVSDFLTYPCTVSYRRVDVLSLMESPHPVAVFPGFVEQYRNCAGISMPCGRRGDAGQQRTAALFHRSHGQGTRPVETTAHVL